MGVRAADMFDPSRVVDLKGRTKDEVLTELVDLLATSEKVGDRRDLLEKIFERERTLSTGVGTGVALPHAKIASVKDFVLAVGRSHGGIDFQSTDGKPAHIIVMIACHESQSGDYLKVLSKLVRGLKDPSFCKRILLASSPQGVVDLFLDPKGPFGGE